MPIKLIDTNTLDRDIYHNVISSKIFKLEWNIRQLRRLAKENPQYPNLHWHIKKLEKISPDIEWRTFNSENPDHIDILRKKARKLLQKKREKENLKSIVDHIRQREMAFAMNKKWGNIIDSILERHKTYITTDSVLANDILLTDDEAIK